MYSLPKPLQKLIAELCKLPSIGSRSAERLAFYLSSNPELSTEISQALQSVRSELQTCKECFFISSAELCNICSATDRDKTKVCVVEKPADVVALEQAGIYRGLYHVLNGLWSPLKGRGSENLRIKELQERLQRLQAEEVILATGSTVEGDATAIYLAKILNEAGIKATRLAQGLPKGGELEFLDDLTLSRALSGRNQI